MPEKEAPPIEAPAEAPAEDPVAEVVAEPKKEDPPIEEPTGEALVVEDEDEDKEPPLTAELFSATLTELVTRARAAGLRPIQMMFGSYVKQGMSMVDGLLGALEGNQKKK